MPSLSELTSIDGRADDARMEGWSKIWWEVKDNDAPAQVQMQKILCHLFQVTHCFAQGTSNVSSHWMHTHNRVYCKVHCLAKLKASAQELDVKRTQSNLAKVQNNSS